MKRFFMINCSVCDFIRDPIGEGGANIGVNSFENICRPDNSSSLIMDTDRTGVDSWRDCYSHKSPLILDVDDN